MTLPDLTDPKSYEAILGENVDRVKELLPGYEPADGDDIILVTQAFSYREKLLREEINLFQLHFFVATATGAYLDYIIDTLAGLARLSGAKPYTTATFELSAALGYDVLVPEGYQLVDAGGVYYAKTVENLTIVSGETSVIGVIELQEEMSSSAVTTEIPVTPLPYLSVTQDGSFANGSDPESDDAFRERYYTSVSDKSTAGANATYTSFALKADERIEDVHVYSPSPGDVSVIYYSLDADALMETRIKESLNDEKVRPINDSVAVAAASPIAFNVEATLTITSGMDAALVQSAALSAPQSKFADPQIGQDVSLSRIIGALMVEGVESANMTVPAANIAINQTSIALLNTIALTMEVSTDEY